MDRTTKESFVADLRDRINKAPVVYLTDFTVALGKDPNLCVVLFCCDSGQAVSANDLKVDSSKQDEGKTHEVDQSHDRDADADPARDERFHLRCPIERPR